MEVDSFCFRLNGNGTLDSNFSDVLTGGLVGEDMLGSNLCETVE
jgi:hypothetical protein